jgi:hypothetical protein
VGKVGTDYIVEFTVRTNNGAPRTGIAGSITPRVRALDTGVDDGSVAAVVEIGNGRYSLVIRGAFTTAQGAGNYSWSAEVTAAPRDLGGDTIRFTDADLDSIFEEPVVDHLTAGTVGRYIALGVYHGAIWFNAAASNSNFVVGIDGTPDNPVSDLNAISILVNQSGLRRVMIEGQLPLDANVVRSVHFIGHNSGFGSFGGSVQFNTGHSADGNTFENLNVTAGTGDIGGDGTFIDCLFVGSMANLRGTFIRCKFMNGTFTCGAGTISILHDCESVTALGATIIDMTNTPFFMVYGMRGSWQIRNGVSPTVHWFSESADVDIDASNSGGTWLFGGIGVISGAGPTAPTSFVNNIELMDVLDHLKNRLEWDFVSTPARLNLYDRAGTTIIHYWEMETDASEKVATQYGVQTKRSAPI